jgi:hypothetical protein
METLTHLEQLQIFLGYFAQRAEDHPLIEHLSGAEIETLKIFAQWLDQMDAAEQGASVPMAPKVE